MERKTKAIPAIITLLAALITLILTYINNYELIDAMLTLLVSVIIFFIVGQILRIIVYKALYIPPLEEEKPIEEENEEPLENEEDNN